MKIFKKRENTFIGSIMGLSGEYADAIFRLGDNETVTIGRDPKTSQIVLDESCTHVSRTHCSIAANSANGTYIVCDFSSNGTFLNGERIACGENVEAARGSILAVGDEENTFRLN